MTRIALVLTMISCLPPADNAPTTDAESTSIDPSSTSDHTPTEDPNSSSGGETANDTTTTGTESTGEGVSTSGTDDATSTDDSGTSSTADTGTTGGDTVLDPDPNVAFLCCAGDDVMCTQGECTPFGYCPMPCDIADPDDCGDTLWAVCAVVEGYRSPICVATFDTTCMPDMVMDDSTTTLGEPTTGTPDPSDTGEGESESGDLSRTDYM